MKNIFILFFLTLSFLLGSAKLIQAAPSTFPICSYGNQVETIESTANAHQCAFQGSQSNIKYECNTGFYMGFTGSGYSCFPPCASGVCTSANVGGATACAGAHGAWAQYCCPAGKAIVNGTCQTTSQDTTDTSTETSGSNTGSVQFPPQSLPQPTPAKLNCGASCKTNDDCKNPSAAGFETVCRNGTCEAKSCTPGQTIPGANCSCGTKQQCGQRCGPAVGNRTCDPATSECGFISPFSACMVGGTTASEFQYCLPKRPLLKNGYTMQLCNGIQAWSLVKPDGSQKGLTQTDVRVACGIIPPSPPPTPLPPLSCPGISWSKAGVNTSVTARGYYYGDRITFRVNPLPNTLAGTKKYEGKCDVKRGSTILQTLNLVAEQPNAPRFQPVKITEVGAQYVCTFRACTTSTSGQTTCSPWETGTGSTTPCATAPTCPQGSTLLTGDPAPGSTNTCPSYACVPNGGGTPPPTCATPPTCPFETDLKTSPGRESCPVYTCERAGAGSIPTLKPPTVQNSQVKGYFDALTCNFIQGWACDSASYTSPLLVKIYRKTGTTDVLVTTLTANVRREAGVSTQCGNQAAHGFAYVPPAKLTTGTYRAMGVGLDGKEYLLQNYSGMTGQITCQ